MIKSHDNNYTETTDLSYAAFLFARGIVFVGIDRANPQRQRFLFNKAPDALVSEWQAGEGKVNARAFEKALHYLKDELFRRSSDA